MERLPFPLSVFSTLEWDTSKLPILLWDYFPEPYTPMLVGLILLTLLMVAKQIHLGANLSHYKKAPCGIVSFELAGTEEKARIIKEHWDQQKLTKNVLLSVKWDFGFLLTYSFCLSYICFMVSKSWVQKSPPEDSLIVCLGIITSQISLWAGIFDAVENLAMERMLNRGQQAMGIYPLLARWCAIPKFGLIGISLAYLLVSWIYWFCKNCACIAHS